jgi:hypothetical protein
MITLAVITLSGLHCNYIFGYQGMLFLDCIMVTRYTFIFWLKNPAAFQDEFWSLFINLWVVGFSWIAQLVFEVIIDAHMG